MADTVFVVIVFIWAVYRMVTVLWCEQLQITISSGSIYNFNLEAYDLLGEFEERVKSKLVESALVHVDESGSE